MDQMFRAEREECRIVVVHDIPLFRPVKVEKFSVVINVYRFQPCNLWHIHTELISNQELSLWQKAVCENCWR